MLRDAEHFRAKIGALDGANDTGDFIVKLVKEKYVPNASAPTLAPPKKEQTTISNDSSNDAAPGIRIDVGEPDKVGGPEGEKVA
jgi:vacuolar protein sorting-associated protein 54